MVVVCGGESREGRVRACVLDALEGEADVDEGGDGLDGITVLGVVGKISLTALVFGVPFEDVKLRVVGVLWRGSLVDRVGEIGERVGGLVLGMFRMLRTVGAYRPVGIAREIHLQDSGR